MTYLYIEIDNEVDISGYREGSGGGGRMKNTNLTPGISLANRMARRPVAERASRMTNSLGMYSYDIPASEPSVQLI
jgi:hypothetical protein